MCVCRINVKFALLLQFPVDHFILFLLIRQIATLPQITFYITKPRLTNFRCGTEKDRNDILYLNYKFDKQRYSKHNSVVLLNSNVRSVYLSFKYRRNV